MMYEIEPLTTMHKVLPNFPARINLPDRTPPMRAYLHAGGIIEAYGNNAQKAFDYFCEIARVGEYEAFKDYKFVLAAIWGRGKDGKPERMIDVWGFSDISDDNWPGNPEIDPWVLREGIYVTDSEEKRSSAVMALLSSGAKSGTEGEPVTLESLPKSLLLQNKSTYQSLSLKPQAIL